MALVAAILLALFVLPTGWGHVAVVTGLAVELGEAAFWWQFTHRRPPVVGVATLFGRDAVVIAPCRPEGQVKLDGELWRASCAAGAEPGDRVRIVGLQGLTLVVDPERSPCASS